MVNLEQKRALNAFEACSAEKFGGKDGGEVVKKLPPQIRENGMLGTLAFALSENNKDKGWEKAFDAIRLHLKSLGKVKADTIAVHTVTPADGPSLGTAPSGKWTWISLVL